MLCFPFVLSVASLVAQTGQAAAKSEVDHTALDAILAQTVRDDCVDYVAVRDEHQGALERYLEALAAVDVTALPEQEKLAYWFNLYNASMIAAVVGRLQRGWSPERDDYAVFKQKLVRVKGATMTLDAVEHETLRKSFKEPRLHVALVCGARSCPPILARAYRGADLDAVLDANMGRFINDLARNRVEHAGKKLRLSRIFDWFKDDFGGEAGIKKLVSHHTGRDVSQYEVSYLEYDWQLNIAAPKEGFLVAAVRASSLSSAPATDDVVAEVQAGDVLRAVGRQEGVFEVVVPGGGKRGFVAAGNVTKL